MHFDKDYILIIHERSFRAFYEPKVIMFCPLDLDLPEPGGPGL